MLANLIVTALGAWGLYFTWTRRSQSGGSLFFDLASSSRNPLAYRFAVGLRLVGFGACLLVGGYRLIFGITA
ncbi:hypothetical protein MW290_13235 [Aquincola tertiaricarbonis]|uniref:Uncharacterized protein n=1 Tax=Aquincola tertiaricarbonis TaxID=391953 RepID=A0ABY4S1Q8_AQUTE|nr:hypothetical protein [Aquincola tertiaricarbonis]URI06853.1 hypothetical protein MW290_13235 [Aquincola tertiaricarbonis]